MAKFIFVTGGVVSSLGKGIASASIGCLLESRGFKVNIQKLDPYINVDPGLMSPFQHGEVYVTEDGTETDLDLGHYERFTTITTTRDNNYTSGRIFGSVIEKERAGKYLGATVQLVPHVTNEIKSVILKAAGGCDVLITEIGGTVGDIESLPFLEAIRQLGLEVGSSNALYIHLTLVPYIKAAGELKTKPTQHSVKELRSIGIQPNILLCRTEYPLSRELKAKVGLFCNLQEEAVITAKDVDCIYDVPIYLSQEGLDYIILKNLGLPLHERRTEKWEDMLDSIKHPSGSVRIAIVGKYTKYEDSYKSLTEALKHGGIANNVRVDLSWTNAEAIEKEGAEIHVGNADGILVPGGFGERGVEGKIAAISYAREKGVPFFGICLGMQLMCIEWAKAKCNLTRANSTEFEEDTPDPVFFLLRDLIGVEKMGANMRLGAYPCDLLDGSAAFRAYGKKLIYERHRHRYEFNLAYRDLIEKSGLRVSGISPDKKFVEMVEWQNHPWYVGCQFHPEFKSRPLQPHPLFKDFISASYKYSKANKDRAEARVTNA